MPNWRLHVVTAVSVGICILGSVSALGSSQGNHLSADEDLLVHSSKDMEASEEEEEEEEEVPGDRSRSGKLAPVEKETTKEDRMEARLMKIIGLLSQLGFHEHPPDAESTWANGRESVDGGDEAREVLAVTHLPRPMAVAEKSPAGRKKRRARKSAGRTTMTRRKMKRGRLVPMDKRGKGREETPSSSRVKGELARKGRRGGKSQDLSDEAQLEILRSLLKEAGDKEGLKGLQRILEEARKKTRVTNTSNRYLGRTGGRNSHTKSEKATNGGQDVSASRSTKMSSLVKKAADNADRTSPAEKSAWRSVEVMSKDGEVPAEIPAATATNSKWHWHGGESWSKTEVEAMKPIPPVKSVEVMMSDPVAPAVVVDEPPVMVESVPLKPPPLPPLPQPPLERHKVVSTFRSGDKIIPEKGTSYFASARQRSTVLAAQRGVKVYVRSRYKGGRV